MSRTMDNLRDELTHIVAAEYLDYDELGKTSKSKQQVDAIVAIIDREAAGRVMEVADSTAEQHVNKTAQSVNIGTTDVNNFAKEMDRIIEKICERDKSLMPSEIKRQIFAALETTLTAAEPEKRPDYDFEGYPDHEAKGFNAGVYLTVQAYRRALGIGGTDD